MTDILHGDDTSEWPVVVFIAASAFGNRRVSPGHIKSNTMGLYSQDHESLVHVNSSTNSEWIDIVRSADDILTEIGAESGA